MNILAKLVNGFLYGFDFERPPEAPPSPPTKYPRIVSGDGVWVNEIHDFDKSIVQTSQTTWTIKDTEEARRMVAEAEDFKKHLNKNGLPKGKIR